MKLSGYAVEYAVKSLRKDREIVLEAVKESGASALEYTNDSLKNDPDILAIVNQKSNE